MEARETVIELYQMTEEQAQRYREFVMFMRAYELEKQLVYKHFDKKENIRND